MRRIIYGLRVDLDRLKEWLHDWLEWQDAKEWAKYYHPGWVQIARKAPGEITRQVYKDKILRAYRGEYDG